MKKFTAIFFTTLYTAFLCFAVTGVFALEGKAIRCTTDNLCIKHSNNVTADNSGDNCTYEAFSAVHFYHKQTGSNKYMQSGKLSIYHQAGADSWFLNTVKPYSMNLNSASCPLFIINQELLL